MKYIFSSIVVILIIGNLSCRKIDIAQLEGNWTTSVSGFEFNGMTHRDAFHVHDTSMAHLHFNDTDMIFVLNYILPKVINFKTKGGKMFYSEDNLLHDFPSSLTNINKGNTMVLCDSIFFTDGYYYGPSPVYYASGFVKLEGKFKDDRTFEGTLKINHVYQRVNDKFNYLKIPIYSYFLDKTIPVRLVKQ